VCVNYDDAVNKLNSLKSKFESSGLTNHDLQLLESTKIVFPIVENETYYLGQCVLGAVVHSVKHDTIEAVAMRIESRFPNTKLLQQHDIIPTIFTW
jgi:hypothetical protein